MDHLWSPWRLQYVTGSAAPPGCVFCAADTGTDASQESLVVHRGTTCYVILNLFPYTNGHLMVAPFEHVPRLQEVDPETMAEMMDLAQQAMRRIEQVYGPEGFNVGLNQGRVAGAGVEGHIHLHVVPRWAGDNNYMPVLADTRVMPQSLEDSYDALEGGFA